MDNKVFPTLGVNNNTRVFYSSKDLRCRRTRDQAEARKPRDRPLSDYEFSVFWQVSYRRQSSALSTRFEHLRDDTIQVVSLFVCVDQRHRN